MRSLKISALAPIPLVRRTAKEPMQPTLLKIDSPDAGYELPPVRRYPFNQMGVGDSIWIDDFRLAQSARVSAINFIKRHDLGWKFGIRKMDKGWRIFRLH
jgi:hypothetical protein